MINDVVDLHTHSIASGHAYNTIYEMVQSAVKKGAMLYGISDHGPAMEGSATKHYFRGSHHFPRQLFGIPVLFGVELNILDYQGAVDLDERFMEYLDYAIASLHISCVKPGTVSQNTAAYIGSMQNPKVCIIGHPDDGTYEVDFDTLAKEAANHHVMIELNEASVAPDSYRINGWANATKMMKACCKYGTNVILSSDAHCEYEILGHEYGIKLMEEVSFPEELIANLSAEKTLRLLQERKDYVAR